MMCSRAASGVRPEEAALLPSSPWNTSRGPCRLHVVSMQRLHEALSQVPQYHVCAA